MWARIANVILGLSVVFAPHFGAFGKTAANNNFIVGPLIITFAVIGMWELNQNIRYCNVVTGAWLVASPFLLSFSSRAIVPDVAAGILVILFSFVEVKTKKRYGGGWQSLFQEYPDHMKEK